MSSNPYEPTHHAGLKEQTAIKPHSPSIRTEAWRGAKFGAKVMSIVAICLVVIFAIGWLVIFVNLMVLSKGEYLQELRFLNLGIAIGGSLIMVLELAIFGGVVGAFVMSVAAILRKLAQSHTAIVVSYSKTMDNQDKFRQSNDM